MKKLIILLIIMIISLLGIIAYIIKLDLSRNQNMVKTEEAKKYDELNKLDPYYKIVNENKNYKVYTDKSGLNYFYNVYNNVGECIDSGFHTREIRFEFINNILSIKMGFGTYAFICRYYDLSTNRVSRFYPTPLEIGGEYIAYFTNIPKNDKDNIVLVIQDIFDEKDYYKEIRRDFSPMVLRVYSETEFVNNNTQLKISYPINSSDEIVTEVINLK